MNSKALFELKNIGKKVAEQLYEIGITSEIELKKIGAAKAYKWMSV